MAACTAHTDQKGRGPTENEGVRTEAKDHQQPSGVAQQCEESLVGLVHGLRDADGVACVVYALGLGIDGGGKDPAKRTQGEHEAALQEEHHAPTWCLPPKDVHRPAIRHCTAGGHTKCLPQWHRGKEQAKPQCL